MHCPRLFPGALTLLTATLVTACATARPEGAPVPSPPLPQGDAAELTAWVEAVCDAANTRTACRESALVRVAEERGIAAAMDVVARLGLTDSDGHAASHMIGIRGYRGVESAAEDFASCTTLHQSGCYHGVVQAYFADLRQAPGPDRMDEETVSALCAPYRDLENGYWSLFQCIHGVGHGVMLVHDHHLPRALETCDLLPTSWERESCYGGAFMESAVTALTPHHDHSAVALAGREPARAEHDDHAHHASHGAAGGAADPFPAINPDDLHYPCSVLDARYLKACYDMQTATMLYLLNQDIAATAAACREAPDAILRAVCHRSLGRDINAITGGEHTRSVALCGQAAPADRPSCHTGVVKNVIDVTADAASGAAYCERVPAGSEREACYRAIGEQTTVLIPRLADRARFCLSFDGANRTACMAGARADSSSATPAPGDPPVAVTGPGGTQTAASIPRGR
ncbi:MAG TPA: hypothetical protein VK929_16640 [Longimicrobiales bacterium]|nr:hypothetical protein [Longimicrobiales bacterium]